MKSTHINQLQANGPPSKPLTHNRVMVDEKKWFYSLCVDDSLLLFAIDRNSGVLDNEALLFDWN